MILLEPSVAHNHTYCTGTPAFGSTAEHTPTHRQEESPLTLPGLKADIYALDAICLWPGDMAVVGVHRQRYRDESVSLRSWVTLSIRRAKNTNCQTRS